MIYYPKEDSFLLNEQVKIYSKNKSVLDMGSGSGIQAETAIKSEAKSVLATDIDKESLDLINSKSIPCKKSDLFKNVKSKFDLIIFNPPYLPEDEREDEESRKATTGGKNGDEIILKFLEQSKNHLNENGKILLLISSLTPQKRIKILLNKLNFKKKILSRRKIFMEELQVWEIK